MNRWLRFALISVLLIGVGYVALMWVAVGGLEQFQPPFEIVIPQNVQGVVCVTSRPGTTEDTEHVVRHEVTTNGLLEVSGDILRSHRPEKLFVRDTVSGQLAEIPSSTLLPIYTENDIATGQWYAVMWLGSADEWNAYRQRSPNGSYCLGRFGQVAAK
jgi:hypothetical protein